MQFGKAEIDKFAQDIGDIVLGTKEKVEYPELGARTRMLTVNNPGTTFLQIARAMRTWRYLNFKTLSSKTFVRSYPKL